MSVGNDPMKKSTRKKRTPPRRKRSPAGLPQIQVFISHNSKDERLAKALLDLIQRALPLTASKIRCTSVPGYKLPGGARTESQLRKEILAAPVFIGLVTEASLSSAYVVSELGARWGANKELILLMAPGILPEVLEGPFSSINALTCDSAADLHALIGQIAKKLDINAEPPARYHSELEIIKKSRAAVPATLPQATISSVPQSAVDALAELRSEAVHEILNRRVLTDAELAALASYTEDWWARVDTVL